MLKFFHIKFTRNILIWTFKNQSKYFFKKIIFLRHYKFSKINPNETLIVVKIK